MLKICVFSFDSDFDKPESEPHGDDADFDEEAYLKWRSKDKGE
jgi:hypothetical protein